MSKKLIAGAGVVASLAVALAPLATFADTTTQVSSHTDRFLLTIPQICTLGTIASATGAPEEGTDATAHTGSTWATTTAASGTTGKTDTFSKDVYNGKDYAAMATTTFTVRCNDSDGYTLSAASGTNDGESTAKATLVNGSYTIKSQTGINDLTVDGHSYWSFQLGSASTGLTIASGFDNEHVIPTTATVIATGANGNTDDGQSVTVTYNAGIDAMQEAGTYEGTVVYTLTALDPVQP